MGRSLRKLVATNLNELMTADKSRFKTPQAVETATGKMERKIGKSTVQRMLSGDTPVNLDYIETLAELFGIEPWQLLAPSLGASAVAEPDLGSALAKVGAEVARIPIHFQESASKLLGSLVSAPRTHKHIRDALTPLIRAGEEIKEPPDPFELEAPEAPHRSPRAAAEKKRGSTSKTTAPIFYGDGNKKQVKLPFPILSREQLKSAVPSPDEMDLWERIEAYPKERK